jgi:phosphatidylserine/phosphatidylglycerophosphate/cardiolipin synthase-like enzyme
MAARRRSGRSTGRSRSRPVRWTWPSLLLVLALLALAFFADHYGWFAEPTPTPVPAPTPFSDAEGGTIGVFVEPDDGRSPVLRELDEAEETITLQVYLISDEEILDALERAHARGVEVRVLLEEHPFGGGGLNEKNFARLDEAGVAVRWSNPVFRFSHVKTFTIDREVAIVMNLNLTYSSFTRNREFGAITTRPGEVAQAVAIFEADWNRTEEPADGPLIVSPTDSRRELLDLIGGAERTIEVYAEVVRDEEILDALTAAEERGVQVRLVVSEEESEDDDRGRTEREQLADAGVEVRFLPRLYVHAKIVLVDRERAYLGSQNFTATSLDQNREIGVIVDDPAGVATISQVFEADFAAGMRAF